MNESTSSSHMPTSGLGDRVRLLRDGAINSFGFVITRIAGILLIPIMLRGLGVELYGLWIAALSVMALVSTDFGLGWSIVRVVSAAHDSETRNEASKFVSAAGNAIVILGVIGALLVGTLGLALSDNLHLSPENLKVAPIVFAMVGLVLLGNQVFAFAIGVLHGLRRFDVANMLAIATTLVWASGVIFILAGSLGIESVVAWQVVTSATTGMVAVAVVGWLEPSFRFRFGECNWNALRPQLSFSVTNQLTAISNQTIWNVPSLLIGLIHGSASIVPYNIGQRFPLAISGVGWRAAEVLFPAASRTALSPSSNGSREVLEVGIRSIVILLFPLCFMLWLFAPDILRVWLGESDSVATIVLQLTAATVFAEAVGVGALNVLWGRGEARKVLVVYSAMAVMSLGLTAVLLGKIGIVGAAWATLVPMVLGSCAFLYFSSRLCRVQVLDLVRAISKGLLLPVTACAAVALGAKVFGDPNSWLELVLMGLGCGTVYTVGLYCSGGREEERMFGREVIKLPTTFAVTAYRQLRSALRHVQFARSSWYLVFVLVDCIRDNWRTPVSFNREFQRTVDPWGYARPCEKIRHMIAVGMLDAASMGRRFGQAFEVGCAEGIFTTLLATRCESLLAVDFSETALTRARERSLGHGNVHFEKWNLREDRLPGKYDLIVSMDVLSCILRPRLLRAACNKLVAGLHVGGYLLVGDVRQSEVFESAWWGKVFIRGAKWITNSIGEHPELITITSRTTDTHILTLFRKVA